MCLYRCGANPDIRDAVINKPDAIGDQKRLNSLANRALVGEAVRILLSSLPDVAQNMYMKIWEIRTCSVKHECDPLDRYHCALLGPIFSKLPHVGTCSDEKWRWCACDEIQPRQIPAFNGRTGDIDGESCRIGHSLRRPKGSGV